MDLNSQPILDSIETDNSSEKVQQIVAATDSLNISESTGKQELKIYQEIPTQVPKTSEEPLEDAGGNSKAEKTSAELQKTEDGSKAEEKEEAAEISYEVPESPRFVLKSWSAVASWKYNLSTDICHICRNNIMDLCIQCLVKEVLCFYFNCYTSIIAFNTFFIVKN